MGELINGRSPEEIKRGLQCHVRYGNCDTECPYEDVYNEPRHECIQNMTKDALALIERLEAAQPKWISVKERFPEDRRHVNVIFDDGFRTLGYMQNMKWYVAGSLYEQFGIKYWSPLPEPPESD